MRRSSNRKKKEAGWAYAFLLPSLMGTAVFIVIPYADVIRRSFSNGIGAEFVGFNNYIQVFKNTTFRLAIWNTCRFLIVCIPLLLVLSLFIAVLVGRLKEKGNLYKTTLLLPMAVPVASIVLLWRVFFHSQGLLNQITAAWGATPIDWMNSPTAFGVLVFTYIWKNLGYDMILWLAGLSGISDQLYEAAKVDGAGTLTCFWYITLPGLKKTVILTAALSLFNSFKVFREAYLIAGDYPDTSIYMLQHLFNNWFLSLDIQKMSAASVLLLLAIVLPALVFYVLKGRAEV